MPTSRRVLGGFLENRQPKSSPGIGFRHFCWNIADEQIAEKPVALCQGAIQTLIFLHSVLRKQAFFTGPPDAPGAISMDSDVSRDHADCLNRSQK